MKAHRFSAQLDQILNLKHELVQLAGKIDWYWIDGEIAPLYSGKGRPGIETRFGIGLLLLKHNYGLSDDGVCERSDLSHWRKRLGGRLDLLLAESLRVAHASGALRTNNLARVPARTRSPTTTSSPMATNRTAPRRS